MSVEFIGLLALKKCIESLNNNAPYVPYQDSKLTMLLSSGLGGNCKTNILVCGSMDSKDAIETVSSLRFGERCSLVESEAKNNADMLAGVLANIDKQIKELEEVIVVRERWVGKEEIRRDELAEEGEYFHAVYNFILTFDAQWMIYCLMETLMTL